jgi:adenylate cyclase
MVYAQAGRVQEARAKFDRGFKGFPDAMKNVRWYMTNWPFKDLQVMERFAEGCIKAGLPGEPTGFYKVSTENRLTGEEIKELFFGRKVTGFTPGTGKQWWIERSQDGKATLCDGDEADTGKSWIEENMLCDQWDNLYERLKDCWVVYRNPEGTPEKHDEFLGAPGYGIYPFSKIE